MALGVYRVLRVEVPFVISFDASSLFIDPSMSGIKGYGSKHRKNICQTILWLISFTDGPKGKCIGS